MNKPGFIILLIAYYQVFFTPVPFIYATQAGVDNISSGKRIYDYYCYQCHGYSGNAETTASAFINPKPRDFTATSTDQLSRESMYKTIRDGRPGTAMAGFARVLKDNDIEAVIDYVRDKLMKNNTSTVNYHTTANGWSDHERYADAFPFVTGDIPLNTPWEKLDVRQRTGKRIYLTACLTCHEDVYSGDSAVWELSAVSFPRKHYSHKIDNIDALSGASVHLIHEQPTPIENLDEQGQRGRQLYLQNCAFCHAPDGSAHNWIGSFLEPRPRDFTAHKVIDSMSRSYLQQVLFEGIPGTSMPAWRQVLSTSQVEDIIAYLKQEFGKDNRHNKVPAINDRPSAITGNKVPTWRRNRNR